MHWPWWSRPMDSHAGMSDLIRTILALTTLRDFLEPAAIWSPSRSMTPNASPAWARRL